MLALILFLACLFVSAGVGVLAGVSDFRGMKIPNLYSVLIFCAFVICYLLLWAFGHVSVFAPILSHVLSFVLIFALSMVLFVLKVWGAGDQKLISAFAVWFGLSTLAPFLIYTTLAGGVLGLAALYLQKMKPVANPPEGSWVAKVQAGEGKVPYGIAIAFGALASFAKIGYFSVDTFRIFIGS